MSPNTERWQQQINSSFEALVQGALLSPNSSNLHQADCSDWRYEVDDLRSVCLTVDDLQRKDWSLRHLEQRSDSRDSGLESDAAADRHHVCATKKPQVRRSTEDRHSQHATISPQRNEQLMAGLLKMDNIAPTNSPTQLHMFTEAQNTQLYGVLGKKKLHAALQLQQHIRGTELTNGSASYSLLTPDTIPLHHSSVSPFCNMSKPLDPKSKCFTR